MADVVGSILVSMGLESAQFKSGLSAVEKQLKSAERNFQKIGKSMQNMGKNLSIGLTAPLVAFGVTATKAAAESRDAMAQVNASLESMGPVAGKTSDQLQKLGKDLQYMSTFDDDEILRDVTANMLTFGNVAGDAFDRGQRAAVDMATKLKMDLKSAAILVGKALNDPVKGVTALGRSGVQLTEQQKKMVKQFVETGQAAKAQDLILGELEKQFKGAGQAARDAVPGSDAINKWNDLQEVIGEQLLVAFERIEPYINRVLDAFTNLSPETQKLITIGLALAAALGPVLFIMGGLVKLAAPMLAFIKVTYALGAATGVAGGGFATLAAGTGAFMATLLPLLIPIAALVAAGALIYANWDKIAPVLSEIGTRFQEAIGPKITALVDNVSSALDALFSGPLGVDISAAVSMFGEFQAAWLSALGEGLVRVIGAAIDIISGAFQMIVNLGNLVVAFFKGDWAGAWEAMKAIGVTAVTTLLNVIESLAPGAINAMRNMVNGIKTWVTDKLSAIWQGALDKIEAVKKGFFSLYDAVVGNSYIPDMVDGIGKHISRLQGVMVDPALRYTKLTKDAFQQLQRDVGGIMERLFPEQARANRFLDEQAKIDVAFKKGKLSADLYAAAIGRLKAEFMDEMWEGRIPENVGPKEVMTPELQVQIEKDFEAMTKTANDNAFGVEAANVRIVDSFKDAADKTIASIQNMVNAIKGGSFLDILGSVIGFGLQLGSMGAFGNKIQGNINKTPGFAMGTNFAPGGMAIVGERGPELVNLPRGSQVIPNHRLSSSNNNSPASIKFDLRGAVMTTDLLQQMNAIGSQAAAAGAMGGAKIAGIQGARQQSRRVK